MKAPRLPSAWTLVVVFCVVAACGTRADADPYYTVTDVSTLTPAQYAALYPGSVSVTLTAAQRSELPGVNGFEGSAGGLVPTYFPMQAGDANAAGTVLGIVPSGQSYGTPYATPTIGFTRMLPDGQYAPFAGLSSQYTAEAMLNSQNQILLTGSLVNPKEIIDLNKGTTTDFTSILSPATVHTYGDIFPYGIADNGAILADYFKGTLILTPPVPAPEPTTLVTIALGLGSFALGRHLRRKG
jgi:hypothetical protein